MLKMGGERPVGGGDRPAVGECLGAMTAGIYHGFYRQGHSWQDAIPGSATSEIRNLRRFVHPGTNPMSHHFANHAEPVVFDVTLDGVGYVTDSIAHDRLTDSEGQRLARDAE